MKECSIVILVISLAVVHAIDDEIIHEIESEFQEPREYDREYKDMGKPKRMEDIPGLSEDLLKKTIEEAKKETLEEDARKPRVLQDGHMSLQMKHYRRGFVPELEPIRIDAIVKERTIHKLAPKLGMSVKDTSNALEGLESSSLDSMCRGTPKEARNNALYDEYRSIDGRGNNKDCVDVGRANTPFGRLLPANYSDGVSSPRKAYDGKDLPNARLVSRRLFDNTDHPSKELAHMAMTWGQFLDHDVTQSAESHIDCSKTCRLEGDCFGIPILPDDKPFQNRSCIEVRRSVPFCRGKLVREQINTLTSYIDASSVYSNNGKDFESLRDPKDRALLVEMAVRNHKKKLLSKQKEGFCRSPNVKTRPCFRAGDARVNENSALASMHTIWNREHNRIVKKLRKFNPDWSIDRLFYEARKIVGAMIQHITYNEFLPAILNRKERKRFNLILQRNGFFSGYTSHKYAEILNSFSTAAYRFGHSLVQNQLNRIISANRTKTPIPMDRFFDTSFLYQKGGIDTILLGLANDPAQKVDRSFAKAVQDKLVRMKGDLADLPALNIQRGRDHGIPGYPKFLSLALKRPIKRFSDLKVVMEDSQIERLESVYKNVNDIDLFVGGVYEKTLKGSALGKTFSFIIGKQFNLLRVGDRFWYENSGQFTAGQLQEIRKSSLAKVICDNSEGIKKIHMKVIQRQGCKPVDCAFLREVNLRMWKEKSYYY